MTNNSFFAMEFDGISQEIPVMHTELLRKRQGELKRVIDAVRDITAHRAWSTLKELEFDSLLVDLKRKLEQEALKQNPDTNKLNRLAGEIKWAERFSDLTILENARKVELTNVTKQLHGKTEKPS